MKNNTQFDPFKDLVLDEEEQAIEDALERGEYEIDTSQETKSMLRDAANRYSELNNSKPITIRIKQLDLIKVKAKARRKNIPYQTLLGMVIHAFAEDKRELRI